MKKEKPFDVNIDEVPVAGLEVSVDLIPEWAALLLGPAYRDLGKSGHVEYLAKRDGDNLVVEGALKFPVGFECSRCGKSIEQTVTCHVQGIFVPANRHRVLLDTEADNDGFEELLTYNSRRFSVEQPFIDAVALTLDAYPRCPESCAGDEAVNTTEAELEQAVEHADSKPIDPRWAALESIKKQLED